MTPAVQQHDAPYDAVIIGGGPAGLTCAIFLGRYRRRVLVIDAGHPRNEATEGVHGFLGHHSIKPGELIARGRAEAESCGVEFRDARVTKIERVGDVFEIHVGQTLLSARGSADKSVCPTLTVRARRLVLAYGVRDTLPDIPEIDRYYGKTVHHCPDCDGFESRDQRIGVIAWGKTAVGLALKMLQWTDDVVVFTHGHDREWDDEENSKLLAERIEVKDEKIVALEGNDGKVAAAILETGERVDVGRIFFSIKVERNGTFAEDLGCKVDPEKADVQVDEHGQTTVEGIWAIGDLAKGSELVITAAADGAIAAISINKSLLPPSRQV